MTGPAPVWDLINGAAAYRVLVTALDLGIFDLLAARGALDAVDVSDAIDAKEPEPVAVLLDGLAGLGLLDCPGEARYALSDTAARYLVSTSPQSMSALVRYSPGPDSAWADLADTIRNGAPGPVITAGLPAFYAQLAPATAPTQAAVAAAVVDEQVRRGRWPAGATVVDLGCGSGAWLTTLLERDARARGVGVELPDVLPVAERQAGHAGVLDRLTLLAGDYLDVTLPVERADVVVLAHVLRAEPEARAIHLLHKAIRLAGPNGVVVVADYPRPDAATADRAATCRQARHELLLSLTVFAATGGTGVTPDRLHRWTAAAGAEIVAELEPVPRQHVYLIESAHRTEQS